VNIDIENDIRDLEWKYFMSRLEIISLKLRYNDFESTREFVLHLNQAKRLVEFFKPILARKGIEL
jgi:hypothetical protein